MTVLRLANILAAASSCHHNARGASEGAGSALEIRSARRDVTPAPRRYALGRPASRGNATAQSGIEQLSGTSDAVPVIQFDRDAGRPGVTLLVRLMLRRGLSGRLDRNEQYFMPSASDAALLKFLRVPHRSGGVQLFE